MLVTPVTLVGNPVVPLPAPGRIAAVLLCEG